MRWRRAFRAATKESHSRFTKVMRSGLVDTERTWRGPTTTTTTTVQYNSRRRYNILAGHGASGSMAATYHDVIGVQVEGVGIVALASKQQYHG